MYSPLLNSEVDNFRGSAANHIFQNLPGRRNDVNLNLDIHAEVYDFTAGSAAVIRCILKTVYFCTNLRYYDVRLLGNTAI